MKKTKIHIEQMDEDTLEVDIQGEGHELALLLILLCKETPEFIKIMGMALDFLDFEKKHDLTTLN